MHASAKAAASPPSDTSWADDRRPASTAARQVLWTPRSRAKSTAGGVPATRPCATLRYSLPPSSGRFGPSSATRSPSVPNHGAAIRSTSSSRPTMATVGVGWMETPSVSL